MTDTYEGITEALTKALNNLRDDKDLPSDFVSNQLYQIEEGAFAEIADEIEDLVVPYAPTGELRNAYKAALWLDMFNATDCNGIETGCDIYAGIVCWYGEKVADLRERRQDDHKELVAAKRTAAEYASCLVRNIGYGDSIELEVDMAILGGMDEDDYVDYRVEQFDYSEADARKEYKYETGEI